VKHNLNLNWLRTFEAASRHLSFTAASHELGLTQTSVSQHIKALETKLGQKLFIRRAKSLRLTDIGEAYVLLVRDALEHIEYSTNGLFGPDMKSTIVVRASMAFVIWLSPRLSAFQVQYPGVGIKLVTSLWQSDHEQDPVDIDILLAPQDYSDTRLLKLSSEFIVPVCGIETAATIKSPVDLTKVAAIHVLGFDDHWARYLAAYGLNHDAKSPRLIVDTSVAACELAAAENGCAIMIERFAQQAIQTGRPIRIVGESVSIGQSHYVSKKSSRSDEKRAADAFRSWLQACF